MKTNLLNTTLVVSSLFSLQLQSCHIEEKQELPNILWITSEDNSPLLGCYGDQLATTPNLDKLASEGFLYTHAYANAPVSAAMRSSIITGIYSCSGGCQHMRSQYLKSDQIHCYPEYFRKTGYYCTNNSKEDYNFSPEQSKGLWDVSGTKGHYKNRKPGQPFFAVFNCTISHESSIHKSIETSRLRHDPQQVKLPPYHPDTPEFRHDWAQYYDKVEEMDTWVGKILKELEEHGELENTIIFYYGDHGGVLCRSKRFVYETGTRIPVIVRIPEKFKYLYPDHTKPGSKIDRLVSLVDLPPTVLSILGVKIPDWMQGKAFLGTQKTPDPQYVYMFRNRMDERYDMSRAVRDNRYRYIRNYMPHRIYGQHLNYLWKAPSVQSWQQAYEEGKCTDAQSVFWKTKPSEELYDTENDPWEVNNLADDPACQDILQRMRQACDDWTSEIKDADFIPEGEYERINKECSLYDYLRSGQVPFEEIQQMANKASERKKENLVCFVENLENKDRIIRYWSAMGLLILGKEAKAAKQALKNALLKEISPSVSVVLAEALYHVGEREIGEKYLVAALDDSTMAIRNQALNALDFVNANTPAVRKAIKELNNRSVGDKSNLRYDLRMVSWLKQKWHF